MKSFPKVPLYEAWRATHGVKWDDNLFDLRKAFLCAAFSELVYHKIHQLEVGGRHRMWMVPCRAYQLIASGVATEDFMETLGRMEVFEAGEFFNTGNIVGVPIRHRPSGIIIVPLRGTKKFYDWIIDALCNPFYGLRPSKQPRFHYGFELEATMCFASMMAQLQKWGAPDVPIYLTGHSLGGAIAGVMMVMQSRVPKPNGKSLINSAYTFGMPRYGNQVVVSNFPVPYPILRAKDPVPYLPPVAFGYRQCSKEFGVQGNLLARGTIDKLFSRILFWNHYMEKYRKDIHRNFP